MDGSDRSFHKLSDRQKSWICSGSSEKKKEKIFKKSEKVRSESPKNRITMRLFKLFYFCRKNKKKVLTS